MGLLSPFSTLFLGELVLKKVLFLINAGLIILSAAFLYFYDTKLITIAVFSLLFISALVLLAYSAKAAKRFEERISGLLKELSVASSRISSVSSEISLTINESNAISNDMFIKTQEMAEVNQNVNRNIDDTIENIKKLMDFSMETRCMAQEMAAAGSVSSQVVNSSLDKIMNIVANINQIKTSSSIADSGIQELKSASKEINSIVDNISDISKQMHLITVNASIEASRAGQYGKSFAVVVKELQDLTIVTDKAIKNISELISEFIRDIEEVYRAVKENSVYVDLGYSNSQEVENNLHSIDSSFNGLLDMISKINALSDEEAALSESMKLKIADMEDLISKSEESTRSLYASVITQQNSMRSIAGLGVRLSDAAQELDSLSGGSINKELDKSLKAKCLLYFDIISDELSSYAEELISDADFCREKLNALLLKHSIAEAAWVNKPDGRFVCSIPAAGIANASVRKWFTAAVNGEKYISPVYISGITKNQCVTLSMPLYNSGGSIVGVAGIDLRLDLIGGGK
jgi:methyl-accepting chemotaxis protein